MVAHISRDRQKNKYCSQDKDPNTDYAEKITKLMSKLKNWNVVKKDKRAMNTPHHSM